MEFTEPTRISGVLTQGYAGTIDSNGDVVPGTEKWLINYGIAYQTVKNGLWRPLMDGDNVVS